MRYLTVCLLCLAIVGCNTHRESAIAAANVQEAVLAIEQGATAEHPLAAIRYFAAALQQRYGADEQPTVTAADWHADPDRSLVLASDQALLVEEEAGNWRTQLTAAAGAAAGGLLVLLIQLGKRRAAGAIKDRLS